MVVPREVIVQERPGTVQQHIIIKCRHISGEVLVHQGKEARHTQGDYKALQVLKGQAVGLHNKMETLPFNNLSKRRNGKGETASNDRLDQKGEIKARIK